MDQLRIELEKAALEAFRRSAAQHRFETIYCAALYTSGEYGYVCDTVSTVEGLHQIAKNYVQKGSFENIQKAVRDLKWSPCDSPYHLENEHLFERSNALLSQIWNAVRQDPAGDSDRVYREVHAVFVDVLKTVRGSNIFAPDCLITLLAGDQSDEARLVNSEEVNPFSICRVFEADLTLDAKRLARLRATRWPSDDSYEP
ncbi:DUF4303 domain-containing protein [uncultured Xylophilus sp.]|uniref:DUF4303 domain-containing protein n=1 Tax=uncultured Xylophilus sp. TaxID=296832 RepID=UPI0025CD6512|nr:DUF4303 domain-containing protein [uncultured Xylophilus sp.]